MPREMSNREPVPPDGTPLEVWEERSRFKPGMTVEATEKAYEAGVFARKRNGAPIRAMVHTVYALSADYIDVVVEGKKRPEGFYAGFWSPV